MKALEDCVFATPPQSPSFAIAIRSRRDAPVALRHPPQATGTAGRLLAPEAPRHVAWGASPRKARKYQSPSPLGAAGAAGCRRPYRAHGVYWDSTWGSRPRLHAFAPLGQSRDEIPEFPGKTA